MKYIKTRSLGLLICNISIIALFVLLAAFWSANQAHAAVVTWDGGGGVDTNWSTGLNWSTDSPPGASDVATFDNTSDNDSTIDASFAGSVAGIDINSGYDGTITQARSLTIGSSHYDQADGTFTGASQDITISGGVTISGGTFNGTSGTLTFTGNWTHTAGGVWNAGSGTVKHTGYRQTFNFDKAGIPTSGVFNNFTYDSTSDSGSYVNLSGDTLYINGNATFYDGRWFNGGGIEVQGNVTVGPWDAFNLTDAALTFTGTGTQTFDLTGYTDEWDSHTTIGTVTNAPTVNLVSDCILNYGGLDLTITNGSLNVGAYELEVADDLNISGGTLNGNTGTLDVNDVIITDGTFNATTGTTFIAGSWTHTAGGVSNHNSGTFMWDGNGSDTWNFDKASIATSGVFNDVTFDCSGTGVVCGGGSNYVYLGSGDTLYVEGDLLMSDGRVITGTIEAQGNVTIESNWYSNNTSDTPLVFSSSGTQIFDLTGGEALFNAHVTIGTGSAAPTVNLASDLIMNSSGQDLTLTDGSLNVGAYELEVADDLNISGGTLNGNTGTLDVNDVIITDGTFNATTGTTFIAGSWTHTAGGVSNHNSGTFMWDGNGSDTWNFDKASIATSGVFNDVTFDCSGTGVVCGGGSNYVYLGSGDTLYVEGDLLMSDGRTILGTIEAQGDVTIESNWYSYDKNDSVLTLAGSSAQTFDLTGAEALYDGHIKIGTTTSTPTVNLASDLTVNDSEQDLTVVEGELNINGYDLTVSGWSGDFVVEDGGTFAWRGTETLTLDDTVPTLNSGSTVKYVSSTGTVAMQDWAYQSLEIATTGGAIAQLGANESIVGNLTVSAGTFDVNDYTMTIAGNTVISGGTMKTGTNINTFGDAGGDTVTISSGELQIESNDTTSDIVKTANTWTNSGGTITYNAATTESTSLLSALSPYNNLTINSSGSTYTLDEAIDVNNTLTITAGTLDTSDGDNYAITVGGDWANSGTFTPRSGTVTLDDVSKTTTISGTTSFNNLTSTTASKAIVFTASTTTTVSGTLTLTGGDAALITITSSSPATTWLLNVSGTSSVDYVNVTDSDASGGNTITHAVSPSRSTNGGNNTNWGFNVAPTVSTVTATQGTDGTGDVTITFIMDDADDDDTLEALVEYDIGGGWTKATVSETGAEASATYGDPAVENDDTYQVGNASGYITSSSGANTVSVVWESATDEAAADLSTAQVRITPYDGTAAGSTASKTSITVDNVDPASLASFARSSATTTTATFTWTAATDSNFNHYEIWIDTSQSDVQGRTSATEWDDSDDTDLTTVGTATTTITGLSKQTTYYTKIWAIDDFGNETTLDDISFTTASSGSTPTTSSSPEIGSLEGGADSISSSSTSTGTCSEGLNPGEDIALS